MDRLDPLTASQTEHAPECLDDLVNFEKQIDPESRQIPHQTGQCAKWDTCHPHKEDIRHHKKSGFTAAAQYTLCISPIRFIPFSRIPMTSSQQAALWSLSTCRISSSLLVPISTKGICCSFKKSAALSLTTERLNMTPSTLDFASGAQCSMNFHD